MAKIGFRHPWVAKYNRSTGTYTDGFKCGHGVSLNIAPNYAEGSLFGDDVQVEYEKTFKDAAVSLGVTTLPQVAESTMFGHTVSEEGEVTYKTTDEGNYVGTGWISVEKIDGVTKYTGNILTCVKFSAGAEDYTTKGENIEFKTPVLEGKAIADANEAWKKYEQFDTAEAAATYVKNFLNITENSSEDTTP